MSAPDRHPPLARRVAQRGMSIVEVMVGMVVALLVGLAATGSAMMFTASQRQGIGAGGSMVNAGTALAAIRDDVAAAGLGFFGDSLYRCWKLNLSVETTIISDGASFVPVRITAETDGDRIDAIFGTQVASGANVLLKSSTTGVSAELRSLLPASTGQAVLLAPGTPGNSCLVRTVTANTASTDDTPQTLSFGSTGKHNKVNFTTNPVYAANDYPDVARAALLGELRWTRYHRVGTDLKLDRPMSGESAVLVRNVMAFKAQYGLAATTAGSTALESWQGATGTFATLDNTNIARVRALRIGIVTRSDQPEKPAAGDDANCTSKPVTAAMPTLFGSAVTADVTNWKCYRFRTAIVVVPLRNLVIGM